MLTKTENQGVLLILTSSALWGLFPVLVGRATASMPPLLFATATAVAAACGAFLYALSERRLHELKDRRALKSLFLVTLCSIVIPFTLFSIGASLTSGLNTSFLLLSEVIFTLIFTHFIGERTTIFKLAGAIGVLIGAGLIVYNGQLHFNAGDILVIASTVTYPIGNFYTKKAMNYVAPSTILLSRLLLGSLFLGFIAACAGQLNNTAAHLATNWKIVLFTGLILYGVDKVIWYEGLKRLDISKAISLALTFPLFSLLFLITVYGEKPDGCQWLGVLIMMAGVYFSIKRASVNPLVTKYAE